MGLYVPLWFFFAWTAAFFLWSPITMIGWRRGEIGITLELGIPPFVYFSTGPRREQLSRF